MISRKGDWNEHNARVALSGVSLSKNPEIDENELPTNI